MKIFSEENLSAEEKVLLKKWQSLTIQNNFIFSKTFESSPELCRRLLEKILKIKIKRIRYIEREKVLESRTDSKGIRLDVYVEEKTANRSFNIEMQVANSDNLAKRIRYYQALIDMDKLKRSQFYCDLGESYIIFVCPFDLFGKGKHMYTFKETCAEVPNLLLGDGTTKIFFNTKGTAADVDSDIKAFLDYVESGIVENDFVRELDEIVKIVKSNRMAVKEFMTYEMTLRERELRGINQEKERTALRMLEEGTSLDFIHRMTELSIERIKKLAEQIKSGVNRKEID